MVDDALSLKKDIIMVILNVQNIWNGRMEYKIYVVVQEKKE